jgi:hypothetical protein
MATISRSGISTGQLIAPGHITNIIDALDGTTANNIKFAGPVTASAAVSASAGFTGSLQGTASWSDSASYALTTPNLNGQAANYYLNASNINAGTLGNAYLPSAINVTRVTASFTGSLTGALTGTASFASTVVFGSITSLPASLTGGKGGDNGVSSVQLIDGVQTNYTASNLTSGKFHHIDTSTATKQIQLNTDVSLDAGDEWTFFWYSGSNDVEFTAGTGVTIVSENSYKKMYATGSVVTAKYLGNINYGLGASDVYALIGSLKA